MPAARRFCRPPARRPRNPLQDVRGLGRLPVRWSSGALFPPVVVKAGGFDVPALPISGVPCISRSQPCRQGRAGVFKHVLSSRSRSHSLHLLTSAKHSFPPQEFRPQRIYNPTSSLFVSPRVCLIFIQTQTTSLKTISSTHNTRSKHRSLCQDAVLLPDSALHARWSLRRPVHWPLRRQQLRCIRPGLRVRPAVCAVPKLQPARGLRLQW